MKRNTLLPLVVTTILFFGSCKKDKDDNPIIPPADPVPACDNTRPPVVMVHGSLASGDTYAKHAMRFAQNSYCSNRLFAFDWNSTNIGGNQSAEIATLDSLIDVILTQTGASKVYLIGHSAGAGMVYNYCSDASRSVKVSKLIYIGGGAQTAPAGPVGEIPTLNIYSDGDLVVTGADIPGATNVKFTSEDHYEVATSKNSFISIYNFLHGTNPSNPDIIPAEGEIKISGRAVVLGENKPVTGAEVKIYEIDGATGQRKSATPVASYTITDNGNWGPFTATKDAYYEYYVKGPDLADRAVHYFREKAVRSNKLVYLRTIPTSFPLSFIFSSLPSNGIPALGVFTASQAVVDTRDNLSVDGTVISGTPYYTAARTTIASFLYDADNNQNTDLTDAGLFNLTGVFLAGIDMYFPQNATPLPLVLNGKTLNVRRIPSQDGVTVPVFD